ncbi:hypothetical protein QJQ45_004628 [Haematococcus lacustris]|nr:hypothetical protein QJQ45_004628 [Haematococcus lacustris]
MLMPVFEDPSNQAPLAKLHKLGSIDLRERFVKLYARAARVMLGWSGEKAQLFIKLACEYALHTGSPELHASNLNVEHLDALKDEAAKQRRLLGLEEQDSLQDTPKRGKRRAGPRTLTCPTPLERTPFNTGKLHKEGFQGTAEQREFVFGPATQIAVGIDPGVTQAINAASGVWDESGLRLYRAQDRVLEQFFKKVRVAPTDPMQQPGGHTASSLRVRDQHSPSAKRSKRTKAEQAAEPNKAQGKAAKAKPAPQPGRWLHRDCNAALNMQHIDVAELAVVVIEKGELTDEEGLAAEWGPWEAGRRVRWEMGRTGWEGLAYVFKEVEERERMVRSRHELLEAGMVTGGRAAQPQHTASGLSVVPESKHMKHTVSEPSRKRPICSEKTCTGGSGDKLRRLEEGAVVPSEVVEARLYHQLVLWVEACSKRALLASLLLGLMVRDSFARVTVLADGQELLEDIPAEDAPIPDFAERNLYLQLGRGMPPPGLQSQPSAAVEDVLTAYPDLHAELDEIPRYPHDRNAVDDVGQKLETSFANSLIELFKRRVGQAVARRHQRHEVARQRRLQGVGQGVVVNKAWRQMRVNRGSLLRHAVDTSRQLEAAHAEVQRLRDVEQSLMSTVDGLQCDLDDLQAAHQGLQGNNCWFWSNTPSQQQQQRMQQQQQQQQQQQEDPYGTWRQYASDIRAMAVNGDPGSPALRLHLEQYYLACPISNAPVESLLQLLKHGGGRYMELPALLQLMSMHTCKEAMKTVDVHDLQQHMGQLRAEVRRKEDATAAAQRSAKAERQITDAAHKVGRVVINVGDHACQQRLAAAHALAFGGHDYGHTTVEEAMKMTGKQLQSYLQFHKQEVHTSWRVPKLLSHVCTHIRGKLAVAAPPQQQLTPAGTTPELAEPAGAPPQQQQQLAAASTSRKRGAPAANKSRAAKQGATHNSVAKRASAARLACGEIA